MKFYIKVLNPIRDENQNVIGDTIQIAIEEGSTILNSPLLAKRPHKLRNIIENIEFSLNNLISIIESNKGNK